MRHETKQPPAKAGGCLVFCQYVTTISHVRDEILSKISLPNRYV